MELHDPSKKPTIKAVNCPSYFAEAPKGVSEMEDNPAWHSRAMTAEMLQAYTQEILSGVPK